MIYPQETWGLGGKNEKEKHVVLDYNYVRVYQSLLKKVGKNFFWRRLYTGLSLRFEHYEDSSHLPEISFYDYKDQLLNRTVSSGPVLNFLIDIKPKSQLIQKEAFIFLLIIVSIWMNWAVLKIGNRCI